MKKRCKHLGCSEYGEAVSGYCKAHATEYTPHKPFEGANKTNPVASHYHTSEWRAFSTAYRKKHPVCALCGKPSQAVDHHLMSAPDMVRQFGRFITDERYYRPLCFSCNTKERHRKNSRRYKQ